MVTVFRLLSEKPSNKLMAQTATRQLITEEWPEIEPGQLMSLMNELGVLNPELFHVELQFVDQETIQELNRDQRQKNESTDILSFPLYSHADLQSITQHPSPNIPTLLGTIVICQTIVDQRNHGLSWTLLHGLRHLFGYDHDKTGETWSPSRN